jgi:glycosyltransferase involved in cell wall biosynthesis
MIKKNFLITVIIPTYNRDDTIKRAIDSVLNQTYKNLELIIVDDGSTDNTKDVIKKYLKDKRIRYFYKQNKGVSSARNLGIKKANGEYIAFLDSDDEFEKNKLKVQLEKMIKFNIFFSICNSLEIKNNKIKRFLKYKKSFLFDKLFFIKNNIPISASLFMLKRNISIFFNEKLPIANDRDFLMRYLKENKVLFIKDPLVKRYRTFDNIRLSANSKLKIKGIKELIKLFKENEYRLPEAINSEKISYLTINLGFWLLLDNKFKKGRIALKKGLKLSKNPKNKIYYNISYYVSFSPLIFNSIKKIGIFLWRKI